MEEGKTYNLVNEKLQEADFFLDRMKDCPPEFETFRFYFSAFCSSCRGVTFALQYVGRKFARFDEWYEPVKERLRDDPLARLFHDFRTDTQKKGMNPVNRAVSDPSDSAGERLLYYFCSVVGKAPTGFEGGDVLTLSKKYMSTVVGVIRQFYEDFRAEIEKDSDEEAMYKE